MENRIACAGSKPFAMRLTAVLCCVSTQSKAASVLAPKGSFVPAQANLKQRWLPPFLVLTALGLMREDDDRRAATSQLKGLFTDAYYE
jgi:hypothetical protein